MKLRKIKNADLIYIMKNGKIIEQGNHQQLIQGQGYYAGLISIHLSQEEKENLNKSEYLLKRNSTIKSINEEEIQFEIRDNAIALSEHDITLRPCAIIRELHEYKFQIFLSCLGALIFGISIPFIGYFMAKTFFH